MANQPANCYIGSGTGRLTGEFTGSLPNESRSMKTILVVDDEKDIVDLVKYNLQREGYTVLTARHGKDALEAARQQPHLILLDIMMPEYDGLEVVKRLKKDDRTSAIPVIFLTAKGTDL